MPETIHIHPAAELFPEMSSEEFAALKADIQKHGLREPIISYTDCSTRDVARVIIDGRHRYRACTELGIAPKFAPAWTGNIAHITDLVISLNLHRRHLTTSQRAIIAAKLANMQHGGDRKSEEIKAPIDALKTQKQAAEMLSVGERSVERAAAVIREGTPEQVKAIESGASTVNAELQKLRPAEPKPEPVWTGDDPESKKIDREHHVQKMVLTAIDTYATTGIKDYAEAVEIYLRWNKEWTPDECADRAFRSIRHLEKLKAAFMDARKLRVVK